MVDIGRDLQRSSGLTPNYMKHSTRKHVPGKVEGIQNSGGSVGTVPSQTDWENFLMD